MLKVRNNTKNAPVKLRDIIARGEVSGCKNLINDNMFKEINDDWIYYITQITSYKYGNLTPFNTNIITAYIYDNYRERTMLTKYADEFIYWDESEDFDIYIEMVKRSIEYVLKSNNEKYKKLYYSTIAEFNPLWNVDGTTRTERELRQTGTIDDTRTGTEQNKKTGTETDVTNGTAGTTSTGTETTEHSGTDTTTESATSYDSNTFYDTKKSVNAPNTTDEKSIDNTEESEHSTTDTLTHNTTDTLTRNTLDTNERDLTDHEVITETRQGNIGVTTTTKLLTEYREFADFNFIETVARDIVNSITFMTY